MSFFCFRWGSRFFVGFSPFTIKCLSLALKQVKDIEVGGEPFLSFKNVLCLTKTFSIDITLI